MKSLESNGTLDFNGLVVRIQATSEALQQDALVVINRSVTARAWLTGYYIVEYELKSKKLNYKDVAQLSLYMAYYRKNKMTAGDNPPIGILLCTAAGKETAEYLAPFTDPRLFLSEYQLKLPTKEEITAFLKRENGTLEDGAKGGRR